MKVILTAVDEPLATGWQRSCGDLPFVEVHRGSILDVPCDVVVSPTYSFGFMDGGIDMVYLGHFGWQLQDRVQRMIAEHHHGELLVGAADIVDTNDPTIPYMVVAPTLCVPTILSNSVNPYLAARATFLLMKYKDMPTGSNVGNPVLNIIHRIAFQGWVQASEE